MRAMEKEDIYEVLSVAESAFSDEKLYKWTVPNSNERSIFIKKFFQFRLEAGFGKNLMEVAVDDTKKIAGVAIWIPPVEDENSNEGIPPDFDKIFLNINNDVRERCYKFIGTVIKAENFFVKPYWTLAPIFIHKEMQRKGIASLLIKKQLKIIDDKHLPCILVTQEENNIPIYERYGFEVAVELSIDVGIMSYGMIRK
ncbi:MAG: GNAT family N-acetyltransferase [Treponema sp.]|nr:GNAT family N-acetyltransferase [Treponema sp.]